jgi:hypothetical protein
MKSADMPAIVNSIDIYSIKNQGKRMKFSSIYNCLKNDDHHGCPAGTLFVPIAVSFS